MITTHKADVSEQLCLIAPGRLAWITEELPPLGPQDVLVQTRTGAISIGSELPQYRGTSRSRSPFRYPHGMGYESVGIVIACGSAVQRVQCGDRVVAFYGHRTSAVVPETQVIVVPEVISDELAILSILTCDAAKGVRKIAPRPEETALITGAGAIGLLTLFILRAYGVAHVDMIEPLAERHRLARLLGARNTWRPQDIPGESIEYAVAFECSNQNEAFALLQEQVRRQGRICITADGNSEPFMLTSAFHEKELQIIGSSDGWDYHQHARWYFDKLQKHPTSLEQIFERRITCDELVSTFDALGRRNMQPVKVLVVYQGIIVAGK